MDNQPAGNGSQAVGAQEGSGIGQSVVGQSITNAGSMPRLIGKNYTSWIEILELVLELRGLKAVTSGDEKNASKQLEAKLLILQTLDESHRSQVRGCETAQEILARLRLIYADNSAANIYRLLLSYYRYEKRAEHSLSEHIGAMDNMRNQLSDLGQKQSEEVYQISLIGSLPPEYSTIMEIWELTHESMRTTPNLVARLLKREEDLNRQDVTHGLIARSGRNTQQQQQQQLSSSQLKEKKKRTNCHKCGIKGHWARECPQVKAEKPDSAMQAQIETKEENGEERGVSFNMDSPIAYLSDKWISDSGASQHMCSHLAWFDAMDLAKKPRFVHVGDGQPLKVVGEGRIKIACRVDQNWTPAILNKVLYVPDLAANLFSVGAAAEQGINTAFGRDKCTLVRNQDGKVVAEGRKFRNKVYVLDIKTLDDSNTVLAAAAAATGGTLEHFHRVLGHASLDRVKTVLKEHNIKFRDSDDFSCPECPMGKGTRASHPSVDHRADEPGHLHVDLSGKVSDASLDGYNYFLLAKDSLTDFVIAYYCRSKTAVPELLARLIIDFEVISGWPVREIHSDNGSEFVNEMTRLLFLKEKVKHWTSSPYCPQQNGRIEREMRTITETARVILRASHLPLQLWKEAIGTAVYLKNRLPTKTSKESPFKRLTGKQPTLSHLIEFGTPCQVIVNHKYITKWDSRTENGFVVGFTQRRNTYRVYIRDRNKTIETSDVIFASHSRENHPERRMVMDRIVRFFDEVEPRQEQLRGGIEGDETNESEADRSCQYETARPPISSTPREVDKKKFVDSATLNKFFKRYLGENSLDEPIYVNWPRSCRSSDQGDVEPSAPESKESSITRPSYSDLTANLEENSDLLVALKTGSVYQEEVPKSYSEAVRGEMSSRWLKAIAEELEALKDNQTWQVVSIPNTAHLLSTKWVFTIKRDSNGCPVQHKARLVVRGFEQQYGVDFMETFAPVARLESFRVLCSLAAANNLKFLQFDVSTAFLNGKLEEDVFLSEPCGMRLKYGTCLKLNRALYGLKQAPRAWNSTFNAVMLRNNFKPTSSDPCVYMNKEKQMYLILYVDDGIVFGKDLGECENFVNRIKTEFKLKVLPGSLFLGIEIRHDGGISLSQKRYIADIVRRFHLDQAKPVSSPIVSIKDLMPIDGDKQTDAPYREAVGCLQYIACACRPDILFATNYLSRFNSRPLSKHWEAVKRVIVYLKSTSNYELKYMHRNGMSSSLTIDAYSDADFANDVEERRSVTGLTVLINGGPVICASRRQTSIALSSTEAEYLAACNAAKELKWLTQFLEELGVKYEKPRLFVDNQSSIAQIKNADTKRRSKHVDLSAHFVRDAYARGLFQLHYVPSELQIADIYTKPLSGERIKMLLGKCKMTDATVKISKLALVCSFLCVMMAAPVKCRFQQADPVVFVSSEDRAMEGIKHISLEAAFVSPCDVQATSNNSASYNIENIAYDKLQELCQDEFKQVLAEGGNLLGCPSPVTKRPKRAVFLAALAPFAVPLLTAATVSIATASQAIYSYAAAGSSYNRLNRFDEWKELIEKKNSVLEQLINDVSRENNLNREIRQNLISAEELNYRRHSEHKTAIMELAQIQPAVAWQSTRTFFQLNKYRDGLALLLDACRKHHFSFGGLRKIVWIKEFEGLEDTDTQVESIERSPDGRFLTIKFTHYVPRLNTEVLDVLGVTHWANTTTAPRLVEYAGPRKVIYNGVRNCVKGITIPNYVKVTYETCDLDSYKDPELDNWTMVDEADYEKKSRPLVVQLGLNNVVQCLYYNITIGGRFASCPPWPFTFGRMTSFNLTDGSNQNQLSYEVDSQFIRRSDLSTKISRMPLERMNLGPEYERDAAMLRHIRDLESKSGPMGWIGANMSVQGISSEYFVYAASAISCVAACLTIAKCFKGTQQRPADQMVHDEVHRETVNVNVNTATTPADEESRIMEKMIRNLLARNQSRAVAPGRPRPMIGTNIAEIPPELPKKPIRVSGA